MKHVKRLSKPVYAQDWEDIWPWLLGIFVGIPILTAVWDKITDAVDTV